MCYVKSQDVKYMQKRINGLFIFFFLLSISLFAKATVNGRFVLVSSTSNNYLVKFQINTDAGTDTLGCSTIIFNFDSSSIAFPETPKENTDYNFLNFQGGNYNSTVTRPLPNQIWINIESIASNQGTVVANSPEWTDVLKLNFKILKVAGSTNLIWQTSDNNWAIYDINNIDVWAAGKWVNENTALQIGNVTASGTNASVPDKFNLYQNYPNPFNPSTVIKFSVPNQSFVSLKVYDITGREVTTLINEEKSTGTYSVNFKADNLSSGMYIYRLACGKFYSG